MDVKEITQLIDAVSKAEIKNFHLQTGDFQLVMDKREGHEEEPVQNTDVKKQQIQESVLVAPIQGNVTQKELVEQQTEEEPKKDGIPVTSPIVGTFYESAGPDEAPFVKVGDQVRKGQVLCIVEAMKLMNDIESELDGTIVDILVQNEQMVEYNQPLFLIQPC